MIPLCRSALFILVIVSPIAAEDSGYGDTYTEEELAMLDRVLEAGNLRRADLQFDKALTKGHGCLAAVEEMLRDPLEIAVFMDETVQRLHASATARSPAVAALHEGVARLVESELDSLSADSEFLPVVVDTPEALAKVLTGMVARQPTFAEDQFLDDESELVLDALRAQLPAAMAWHDAFAPPFEGARQEAASQWRKEEPAALHEAASRLDPQTLLLQWREAFGDPGKWLPSLPATAFPADRALVIETPYGRVALGTPGDDLWTGDYAALIDPGGHDRYQGCRIGAAWGSAGQRVGFFADLGGDDVHDCGEINVTLGAAVLGVAAFYDLGAGNDRYVGGHASLGAAMGGMAVFYDDGGSDVYSGRTYTQGAAGFGVAVFMDDSVQARPETSTDEGTKEPVEISLFDNDRISAWANAQAFARARAVAYCINRRGNDTYEAGGVYLHAPLFADRYQSFSQGFAIGERGIDWAGGIAMLIDHEGNDRYLGDIYDQGVGYWYSAGLLWDGLGNDSYEMTQYGQGSGIHLAVGGLIDGAGDDTYVMHSGLGQGGSHDYAASVLHDRGGNDRYHGSTSCNGCGLTNSVGLHFDRGGNDLYGARKKGGWNSGRPARDFSSIGVLVDLGGADDYIEVGANDSVWRHSDVGLGVDVARPQDEPGRANTPAADQPTDTAEIPAICRYEGELGQEVFDELWEIAVRWEVGDNRFIVPEARKRLIAFGVAILPMLDGKVETDNSGLEMRAFEDVLRGLAEAGGRDGVLDLLRTNATSKSTRRQRVALHLVGKLKVIELEDAVVEIVAGDDPELDRRAATVLQSLGSHRGDEILLGWLTAPDTRRAQAAVGVLVAGETDCWDALAPLLDHDDFSLRTRLVTVLGQHLPVYADGVLATLATDRNLRTRRSALDILARSPTHPDARTIATIVTCLEDDVSYVRADAARVVRAWERLDDVDTAAISPLLARVTTMAKDDPDPFVRSMATSKP